MRTPDIDLKLPGLGRFRVSAETEDPQRLETYRGMVKELALRPGGLDILRGRQKGRYTTQELAQAYLQGPDALQVLLERAKTTPLFELAKQYLATKQRPERIRAHLDAFCDHYSVLDARSVENFLSHLEVSGATKNRYRASLSGFGSWCIRHGYLDRHPISFGAVARHREATGRMPELSHEEWKAYLAALPDDDFRCFFKILMHTGADVGEVLQLAERDCFFDVDRGIARLRFKRSKIANSRERFVPIPWSLANEIRQTGWHTLGWRFCYLDSRFCYLDSTIRRVHEFAREQIGRPDLRRKDFRHLAAIAWRKAGVDLGFIQEWLGHSNLQQTLRYAAYKPGGIEDAKAAEEAAKIING